MSQTILFALRMDHLFFGVVMTMTALFLILLVLVQRGRGGGLSGALGGMGGQSAFGTKAGDTFTRITIAGSIFWILLCILSVRWLSPLSVTDSESTPPARATDGLTPPPVTDGFTSPVLDGVTSPDGITAPDGSAEDASPDVDFDSDFTGTPAEVEPESTEPEISEPATTDQPSTDPVVPE